MRTVQTSESAVSNPNQAAAIRLAATLLIGGSMHFIAPTWFDGIIPPRLPGRPRAYTYVFGIAALGIGTGLSVPNTRRMSANLAATFFIAVMPAKVHMACDWWRSEDKSFPARTVGIMQLFWQLPLLTETLKARRNAVGRAGHRPAEVWWRVGT